MTNYEKREEATDAQETEAQKQIDTPSTNAATTSQEAEMKEPDAREEDSEAAINDYFNKLKEGFDKVKHDPKFIVEMIGIAAAIGVLVVYMFQLGAMRTSNKLSRIALTNAKQQFQQDQRPYMWPIKFVPQKIKVNTPIEVNSYFVNYGKTPALREKSAGKVLVKAFGEDILTQADDFFASFNAIQSKLTGGSEIVVPPGIPPNPKDSQAFATHRSDAIPRNTQAVEDANKTDYYFGVVGVILYEDSAGNHYRSDFCMMHQANEVIAWCARHNEIH